MVWFEFVKVVHGLQKNFVSIAKVSLAPGMDYS
jgi:hypothetical protein